MALIQGVPLVNYRRFLSLALGVIQTAISQGQVDEYLLISIACLGMLEMCTGDYNAALSHFKGIAAIAQYVNNRGQKLDPMITFMVQTAWNAGSILALCGYDVAIPDELVAKDLDWVVNCSIGDGKIANWIAMEIRLTQFLYEIAIYQRWATQIRRRNDGDPSIELQIAHRGEELKSALNSWAEIFIPSFYPSSENNYSLSNTGFLQYPQIQFLNFLHAEIYLLWCTSRLIISFVEDPLSGPIPERLPIAIRFCQCLATLGEQSTLALKSLTFGLLYATLTFEDAFRKGTSSFIPTELRTGVVC